RPELRIGTYARIERMHEGMDHTLVDPGQGAGRIWVDFSTHERGSIKIHLKSILIDQFGRRNGWSRRTVVVVRSTSTRHVHVRRYDRASSQGDAAPCLLQLFPKPSCDTAARHICSPLGRMARIRATSRSIFAAASSPAPS